MKYLIISLLSVVAWVGTLSYSVAQQENGGVQIRFGNDMESTAPVTLQGNDPAIPPKPKRQFNTNSMVLNAILSTCDEDIDVLNNLLEKFQKSEKITLVSGEKNNDCFTIVYNYAEKNVVALLDKGSGRRVNLLNNQFETEEMYPETVFGRWLFLLNE